MFPHCRWVEFLPCTSVRLGGAHWLTHAAETGEFNKTLDSTHDSNDERERYEVVLRYKLRPRKQHVDCVNLARSKRTTETRRTRNFVSAVGDCRWAEQDAGTEVKELKLMLAQVAPTEICCEQLAGGILPVEERRKGACARAIANIRK